MRTIAIHHAGLNAIQDTFLYRLGGGICDQKTVVGHLDAGRYSLAGTIDAPGETVEASLEHAFAASQNGDHPWNGRARSTSMGDVLIADGVAYVVASLGFDRLDGYRPAA